jgi:hypothetical protein
MIRQCPPHPHQAAACLLPEGSAVGGIRGSHVRNRIERNKQESGSVSTTRSLKMGRHCMAEFGNLGKIELLRIIMV